MKNLLILLLCGTATVLTTGCSTPKEAVAHEADPLSERSLNAPADHRAEVMAVFMDATKARLSGNITEATVLFEKCLKLSPGNGAAMFELSKLYHMQQRAEPAIAMAEKATAADKDNIWYRFLLADLYLQHGRTDAAAGVYRAILKKWPERMEVYFDLANALAYSGKVNEARQVYRDLEQKFGRSQELVMEEFSMLAGTGDLDGARDLLEEVVKEDPDDLQYIGMLADLYDEMGERELAYAQYMRIMELDPGNSLARLALAEHFYALDQLPEAYEQLSMAFSDPDLDLDAKMQVLLGFYEATRQAGSGTAHQEEQLRLTYDLIGTLERAHPESGKPHTIHGDFLLRDGRGTEARTEFRKALEYEKDRFPIWQQLLQLDLQIGDLEALHADAEEAIELFPTQPTLYLFNGIGLSQLGRHQEAIEALITGRDLVVDDPGLTAQFWSSLGDAYNDAKEYSKSDEAFDRALKLDPDNPTTLNNFAYYLSLRNDRLEKAAEMSLRSNELAPGQPSFQDTYGWVLFQQGKYKEARTWVEKAIANGGNDGVILEHLGDILFQLGDREGALEQWRKAMERGGASDDIEKKVRTGGSGE